MSCRFAPQWEELSKSSYASSTPALPSEVPRPPQRTLERLFWRRRSETLFRADCSREEHVYSVEHGLRLHLLRPPGAAAGPEPPASPAGCVVWFHGGAWLRGTPSQFHRHARALSQDSGFAVASCEYRQLFTHLGAQVPFDSLTDAARCVRFLQGHADEFGLDRSKFVLAGISAGGHSAAMTALEAPAEADQELGLAGLVLFNPVLDLGFATGWSRQSPMVWLGSRVLRLLYGPQALEEKSPIHRVRRVRYPTLILHGADDKVIPIAQSEVFKERMRLSGNSCQLVPFPDVGHRFMRAPQDDFCRSVGVLGAFLRSLPSAIPFAAEAATGPPCEEA